VDCAGRLDTDLVVSGFARWLSGFGVAAAFRVDLAFFGDAWRRATFFADFFVIVLFFRAVLVFLRVDALADTFLRFAFVLAVAFFLVAIKASLDVEATGSVPNTESRSMALRKFVERNLRKLIREAKKSTRL
jgi:ABC-type uncharacterized transport system permease subunit